MPSLRHEELVRKAKVKFEKQGYNVRTYWTGQDATVKPDLRAEKGNEVIVIEVVTSRIATTQVRDYQKEGKVILLFDFERDRNDFEVWGTNDLS